MKLKSRVFWLEASTVHLLFEHPCLLALGKCTLFCRQFWLDRLSSWVMMLSQQERWASSQLEGLPPSQSLLLPRHLCDRRWDPLQGWRQSHIGGLPGEGPWGPWGHWLPCDFSLSMHLFHGSLLRRCLQKAKALGAEGVKLLNLTVLFECLSDPESSKKAPGGPDITLLALCPWVLPVLLPYPCVSHPPSHPNPPQAGMKAADKYRVLVNVVKLRRSRIP